MICPKCNEDTCIGFLEECETCKFIQYGGVPINGELGIICLDKNDEWWWNNIDRDIVYTQQVIVIIEDTLKFTSSQGSPFFKYPTNSFYAAEEIIETTEFKNLLTAYKMK